MLNNFHTEKNFYARLQSLAVKYNITFVRIENTIISGVPDTIVLSESGVKLVELKKLNYQRTKLQDSQVSFFMSMLQKNISPVIVAFEGEALSDAKYYFKKLTQKDLNDMINRESYIIVFNDDEEVNLHNLMLLIGG